MNSISIAMACGGGYSPEASLNAFASLCVPFVFLLVWL